MESPKKPNEQGEAEQVSNETVVAIFKCCPDLFKGVELPTETIAKMVYWLNKCDEQR